MLTSIVAPLMAKDRIRTGTHFSLLPLVLQKMLSVNRTQRYTGHTDPCMNGVNISSSTLNASVFSEYD